MAQNRYWPQPYQPGELRKEKLEEQAMEGESDKGSLATTAEMVGVSETKRPPVITKQKPAEQLLTEAIELHNLGVAGDKAAVVKAYDLLEKLHHADPHNPMAEAYFGSALALLGRDAIDPMERFSKALRGLKTLDRVATTAPENIQVRIIRGYVCYRLPEIYFHRTGTAIEDFGYLITRYQLDNTAFTEDLFWQILYDLGDSYKRLGRVQEAKATWSKLLTSTTGPKYRELLKKEGMD